MFPCAGSTVDLIGRLQARLKQAEDYVDRQKEPAGLKGEFSKLESDMTTLKDRLSDAKYVEDNIVKKLNTVTRGLDEMLARKDDAEEFDRKSFVSKFKEIKKAINEAIDAKYAEDNIVNKLNTVTRGLDEMLARKDDAKEFDRESFMSKFEEIKKAINEAIAAKYVEDNIVKILKTVTRGLDEMLARKDDAKEFDRESFMSKFEEIKKAINEAIDAQNKTQDTKKAEPEEEEFDEEFPLERKLQEGPAWAHLKLVVDSMEKQLKLCLFSLTVFPPDAVIKKRLLFHWWMAEDFVKDPTEGDKCFKQLIDKGFVIPLQKRHCTKWHYCKIQVWLRRLFIAVAASNAFLEYDDVGGFPSNEYTRSPRACFRRGGKQLFRREEEVEADRRLKVIYNVSSRNIELSADWLVAKGGLVAMQLGRWKEATWEDKAIHVEVKSDEFLKGIGNCHRLKYVSLRGVSRVEKLDKSVGDLNNLVVLDLRACHNLETLPEEVASAKKLQFLDISECYLLDQMPKSLANLTELQVLKGFVVGDFQNKNICQIADLVKLPRLRKLSINLGREFKDAEVATLGELKELTSLAITWGVVAGEPDKSKSGDEKAKGMPVPEKSNEKLVKQPTSKVPPQASKVTPPTPGLELAPLPNLKKLDLWCFTKENLPEWISPGKLPNVEKLYIRGGMLRTLGDEKGWKVEVLRLRFLKYFGQDWQNLRSSFPNLKCVTASECHLLEEKWPFSASDPEEDDDEEVNFRPDGRYWDAKKEK